MLGSLGVGRQIVELLGQLVLLSLHHGLHGSVALRLGVNASQITLQVKGELSLVTQDEHASERAEHLLFSVVALNLSEDELGLLLLICTELDLSVNTSGLVDD